MRARSASAMGVADQVLSSATNFTTAFLASYVLLPADFGAFVVAYAVVTVLGAAARALVGEPLLAHLSVVTPEREEATLRSAIGAAACLGVTGGLLCGVLGMVGVPGLSGLLWLAPWVPIAVVQDACRFTFLCRSRTGAALGIDAAWVAGQALALGVVATAGAWSVATIAASWGLGALCGVVAAAVVSGGRLRPDDPRSWLRDSRYLSGWFTLTSVLGQAEVYAVLVIAGVVLLPVEAAGLRAVQLLAYQPAVTLMGAMLVLVTPVVARAVAAGDVRGVHATRRTAVIAAAVLALAILLVVPLRGPLLAVLFPRYTDFGDLVLPVALQSAVLAMSVPFHALLRGHRRARTEFLFQVLNTACLVGAATAGMVLGGVLGLAWAMTAAAGVTLAGFAWLGTRLTVGSTAQPLQTVVGGGAS